MHASNDLQQSRTSGQLVSELLTLKLSLTKGMNMYLCVSQCVRVCERETEKMIRITESEGLRKMKKARNKGFGLVWVHCNPWATCLYIP